MATKNSRYALKRQTTSTRLNLRTNNPFATTTTLSPVNLMQNQNSRQLHVPLSSSSSPQMCNTNECSGIREVWHHNLEEEFKNIRTVVQKYKFVAVDTEYPGVVARPVGEFCCHTDFNYQYMRCNVNQLRIIQLGLCFMDEHGNLPMSGGAIAAWQFNFKFDVSKEMGARSSIDLLMNSGFQFDRHKCDGIEPFEFAELLMSSGVVLVDDITFITFHSDYDFGYLLRVLTDSVLPEQKAEFFELVNMFFPNLYDVKCLILPYENFRNSGLQELAKMLNVVRIGKAHQAGSDALLTGTVFFKLLKCYYNGNLPGDNYKGLIYGLSNLKPVLEESEDDYRQERSSSV